MLSRAGYPGAWRDDYPDVSGNSHEPLPTPFVEPERLQTVDSTNRYLVELVRSGMPGGGEVPEGYAVVAEAQSDGRGRLGRHWRAPPGSAILCSILLKPKLPLEKLPFASFAVALAGCQACREAAQVELSLKWPNDLLVSVDESLQPSDGGGALERKVAGILAERVPPGRDEPVGEGENPESGGIVVGIGINVNWPPDWPPADSTDPELGFIAARGTSLNRITGRQIDRTYLTSRLLRRIQSWNARLAGEAGLLEIGTEFRRRCATIGREVTVDLGDETVAGIALDVDDAGRLLVSTGTCIRTIAAGDVVHVR